MSRKEEAPSGPVAALWSALWRWTKKGKERRVVVVLLGLGFLVAWQWDHIKQLPGVRQVVELASREPIPKSPPPPRKFRVAVANLDRDPTGEVAHIIRQSLHEEPCLDVVAVDVLISTAGGALEKAAAAGHEKARKYLKQTHADVLIWGTVLASDEASDEAAVPQLYLTTAPEEGAEESGRPRRYPREASQQLPPLFWHDLTNVLRLAVLTQAAGEFSDKGHYLASKLPDFTYKVRQLLLHSASWDAKARASTQRVLADALGILGIQTGKEQRLLEAISLYEEALGALTRQQAPSQWAVTQNNLGIALATLGERESGTARLEEAVRAFRAALEEYTREKAPLQWATTQNNLGRALHMLGIMRRDAGLVCEALQRHAEAREVLSAANHAKEESANAGLLSARHTLNALSPKAAEACHT